MQVQWCKTYMNCSTNLMLKTTREFRQQAINVLHRTQNLSDFSCRIVWLSGSARSLRENIVWAFSSDTQPNNNSCKLHTPLSVWYLYHLKFEKHIKKLVLNVSWWQTRLSFPILSKKFYCPHTHGARNIHIFPGLIFAGYSGFIFSPYLVNQVFMKGDLRTEIWWLS